MVKEDFKIATGLTLSRDKARNGDVLETTCAQTIWLTQFTSYRAEPGRFGRFDVHACNYFAVSRGKANYTQSQRHNMLEGTFKVPCDGKTVECYCVRDPVPAASFLSEEQIRDFFAEKEKEFAAMAPEVKIRKREHERSRLCNRL